VSAAMPGTGRRRAVSLAFRGATFLALLLVVVPAVWLIAGIISRAVPSFRWGVLVHPTVGNGGGIENAILGTLILMLGVLVIAGGLGILAGLYLAEYSKTRKNGKQGGAILRTASDVLSGFPSIVLGYVGYVALVVGLHWKFSLLPAWLILSIMVIPYIAKSTETALRQVPTNYREGAEALGMPEGYALRKVTLRTALPGIVTGVLIALAIAGGETAPLVYTAGAFASSPISFALTGHPVPYLTYLVYGFFNLPSAASKAVAYDAALVLVVMVLMLLVSARLIVNRTQRFAEGRAPAAGLRLRLSRSPK
jgi:phosphate transport system permease protein